MTMSDERYWAECDECNHECFTKKEFDTWETLCPKCLTVLRKRGAVDFGFWLVNAPNKEIHKRKWIEQKYDQYLKELGAKKE